MARTVPMRVGEVELLVEVETVGGSEATSRLGDVAERVIDGFGEAEAAVVAVCERVASMVAASAGAAARPDSLEVQFGLKFSVDGRVIVAGASAEASLVVSLTYKPDKES